MGQKKTLHIIEKRNLWFLISAIVISIGLGLMGMRAFESKPVLNFGIDFVSGSSYMLKFDKLNQLIDNETKKGRDIRDIRTSFSETVRKSLTKLDLANSVIQITAEEEVIIKCKLQDGNKQSQRLLNLLREDLGALEVLEIDFIGPTIGAELRETSIWIVLAVSVFLLLYITWRFEFGFGLSSIIALAHDALVTISLASILMIEINTAFVAAILTILGYSINDTIVVFDRIRENKKLHKDTLDLTQISNLSIQQTLTRTINTSITTLVVISSLLIFGGTTIKSFCLVLLLGILSGTYSSVFIASPSLLYFVSEEETEE